MPSASMRFNATLICDQRQIYFAWKLRDPVVSHTRFAQINF